MVLHPIIDTRPLNKDDIVCHGVVNFLIGKTKWSSVIMTCQKQLLALEFIDRQDVATISDQLLHRLSINKKNCRSLSMAEKKHWQTTLQNWQDGKQAAYLRLCGTDFQQKVWRALLSIKHGNTISYSDLAKKINSHHRAVAKNGVGRNHISYFVPCHRVIAKHGGIGGFGGGLAIKRKLLQAENISL